MIFGKVKWFNNAKGFGFIAPNSGGEDIFVHYSVIKSSEGYRTLTKGQEVEFDAEQGPKGMHATSVEVTSEVFEVDG